jgi:curved DNA-binding protein CbpA
VPADREPDELYAILGLAPDASLDDIRRAYHQLATRWHPDRAGPDATFIFPSSSARGSRDRDHATAAPPERDQ